MATRISSFAIPNAFLQDLNVNSPLISGSMLLSLGIAITAIEQVSRQNCYIVDGDSQKRITTLVSIHWACLFASTLFSGIAYTNHNAAYVALAAVSLGGAFWSLRQILQINSTRPDGYIKSEIDFAAKRTLLGLVSIIGIPCLIVGRVAVSYYLSQRV
jgi:hypothetical protein